MHIELQRPEQADQPDYYYSTFDQDRSQLAPLYVSSSIEN